MAIRAGGGGLKYALPNQGEIQARQAAAAASAGGSASAAAYGANRRYAGLKKQIQADFIQSGLDRQFKAQQAFFDRENSKGAQLEGQRFRGEQAQLDRDFSTEQAAQRFKQQMQLQQSEQGFSAKESERQREFYEGRDAARFEQEQIGFEREVDAGIEQGIRSGELELDPKTQQRLRQLEQDRAAVQGKEFDDEARAEFDQQYQEQRRRLLRTAKPGQGPSLGEQFHQEVITDPQTGQRVQRNRSGEWVPFEGDGGGGEYRQHVTKLADSMTGTPNPGNNNLPYTRQQALEAAAQQMQTDDSFFNPPQPLEHGQPPAGGADVFRAQGGGQQAAPARQAQAAAGEIRGELENVPLDPKTETLAGREFFNQNMEDIVQYWGKPTDQIPEESRAAVDFFGRQYRSAMSGEPITLRDPSEAQYLPPGTTFIDPEGKTRRVP